MPIRRLFRAWGWLFSVPAQASAPKGATVMFAVTSAFNQVGLAFMVAVLSLGLLTLL